MVVLAYRQSKTKCSVSVTGVVIVLIPMSPPSTTGIQSTIRCHSQIHQPVVVPNRSKPFPTTHNLFPMNFYLLLRAIPFFLAGSASVFNVDDWISVMLGPDCWDYTPSSIGLSNQDPLYGTMAGSGQRYGAYFTLLHYDDAPLAQSLRYAVSGVGVHLIFIALGMVLTAVSWSAYDGRAPAAMLLLDGMTLANATGVWSAATTAGHPRCRAGPWLDCARGLAAFAPVVVLDVVWGIIVLVVLLRNSTTTSTKSKAE